MIDLKNKKRVKQEANMNNGKVAVVSGGSRGWEKRLYRRFWMRIT